MGSMTPPQLIAQSECKQRRVIFVPIDQRLRKAQRIMLIPRIGHVFHIASHRILIVAVDPADVTSFAKTVYPDRRRMHGDIQNHSDTRIGKQSHHLVKPVKSVYAIIRFKAVPAQMPQAHRGKPCLLHHLHIDWPTFPRPVMRVVICSNIQTHGLSHPFSLFILIPCISQACLRYCYSFTAPSAIPLTKYFWTKG